MFSCSCSHGFGVPLGPVGVTAARNFTRKRPPDSEVSYELPYVGQLVRDLMGTWEPVFFTRKRPRRGAPVHHPGLLRVIPIVLRVGQLVRGLRIWRSLTSKVSGLTSVLLTNQKKWLCRGELISSNISSTFLLINMSVVSVVDSTLLTCPGHQW